MDNRIKVFTFTRSRPQATQADILAAQSKLDDYCRENVYCVVGSAFTKEPSSQLAAVMNDIIADMQSKGAELLVVPDISRLGRHYPDVLGIAEQFAAAGIEIETVDDGCRLTDVLEQDDDPFVQGM